MKIHVRKPDLAIYGPRCPKCKRPWPTVLHVRKCEDPR